jgi:hypothetical protein
VEFLGKENRIAFAWVRAIFAGFQKYLYENAAAAGAPV